MSHRHWHGGDGVNGPQFIADNYLAEPYPMDGQRALVPSGPGLGITIDEEKVARFAQELRDADNGT